MVSSLGARIGKSTIETGLHVTTPSPWQVQKLLRAAVNSKSKYFILEATSHGLDQNRMAFINFKVAALTNITSEHLDYHKNWQNYAKSKSKLFKGAQYSILNNDDKSFNALKDKIRGKIVSYGLSKNSAVNPKKLPLRLNIPGKYNLYNALCAAAIAQSLGIKNKQIQSALYDFSLPHGRMEEITLGQNFRTFVDFAHTENGLMEALKALRSICPKGSRLIAVFGTAGKRDYLKRPKMGSISADKANITIITSEDPRSEDENKIAGEIAQGLLAKNKIEGKDYFIENNRSKAINLAIKIAKKGDVVGFFGKGHEKSMNIGGEELPWDEVKEVKSAIRALK
jgi:UDP-N-acetylmuramoyl-L-alanyl-D-glutamate--2,6-diaminopimelate ligase